MPVDLRHPVERALDRVNGPQLVSWPVFGLTLLVSVAVHFAGSPDLGSGHVAYRRLAVLAGNVALFGILAATGPLRHRPGTASRVWLVVALLVGGAVRGVVLQLLLVALGLTDSLNVAYRLPAGIATSSVAAALFSAIIGAMRERAVRVAAAQQVHDGLVEAIRTLDEGIEQRQEQAAERIVADLHRQLDLAFGANADIDGRLRDLADDVVRPLSHALAQTVPVPPEFVSMRVIARVRPSDAWRGLRAVDGLSPVWMTAIPIVAVIPAVAAFVGRAAVPAFMATLTVILLLGTAALRAAARPVTAGRPPWVHAVVLTASLFLLNVSGIVLVGIVEPGHTAMLVTGFIYLPLIGWSLAIAASTRRAIIEADAQIARDTARLRWVSARLAAIRWQQQGDLSRALHGPVQTAIHGAVSQIKRAEAEGADLGVVVAQQRESLTTAIMRLALPHPSTADIDHTLVTAIETWSGIASIDVDIAASARAALQVDSVSTGVFVDVVVEAVSNAVRHGNATSVRVSVEMAATDLLGIAIVDNGRGRAGRRAHASVQRRLRAARADRRVRRACVAAGRDRVSALATACAVPTA